MPYYLSRRRVLSGEWTMTGTVDGVGPTVMTIPAGYYYLDSTTASESLVAQIDTLLEANFGAENFTCTWSSTTGGITVACQTLAGTWALSFNETSFSDWTGMQGGWAASANATQLGPNVCQGVIFTGSGRATFPGILRETSGATVISESGKVAHIGSSSTRYRSSWQHGFEAYTGVISPYESGTWAREPTYVTAWCWADFWAHHASTGEPFRYHGPGVAVGSHEDTYVLDGKSYTEFAPTRVEDASDRYWQVRLEVAKFV